MQKQMRDAKSAVVMNQPFFASILLGMDFIECQADDPNVSTMATDGLRIFYNTGFVESMTLSETVSVLIHEVMHVIFKHHLRLAEVVATMGESEHTWAKIWNVATDYAINLQLRDQEGLALPEPHLYDKAYTGMTAEEILDKLIQNATPVPAGGGMGVVLPGKNEDGSSMSKADITRADLDLNGKIVQAGMAAKRMGKLPGFAQEMIDKLTESRADWRQALAGFVSTGRAFGYDWSRPNRRAMQRGLILPSFGAKGLPALNAVLDTSGSVSRKAFVQFLSELNSAIEAFEIEDVMIVQCDAAVSKIERRSISDGELLLARKGFGGTDMNPAFDLLAKERPAPTILFSDFIIPELRPFPSPRLYCRFGSGGITPPDGPMIDVTF